jgi:Tol biopolymer transport system component
MFRNLILVGTVFILAGRSDAVCVGDCGNDGAVTVYELILGVDIALGSRPLSQCPAFETNSDGKVTINELVSGVKNILAGCHAGNFAGDYSGSVDFDATHSGAINLSAETSGTVSGSLLVAGSHARSLSFTFPIGGVSVALSGTYDPSSGGFEVEGSFVDANGQTIPVVISGNLPGPTGSAPINVYVGTDMFSTTLSAGTLATPTPTPKPTQPPDNGPRIVYASGLPAHIFVMNVDGSGQTQLTNSIGNQVNPAWSPDGSKIAFARPDDQNNHIAIAVMNADGSDVHAFEQEAFLDQNPAWSPDGNQIVFTAGGGDNIDVMNADGSGRHRLVTYSAGELDGHLSWSPDGTRIAFESTLPRGRGSEDRFEIWVMNADGSNLVRLTTNDVPDRHPAWSVDGAHIAFSNKPNAFSALNVYLMSPDGSGVAKLTQGFFGGTNPAWSHNGQQIAYSGPFGGITVANADGSSALAVPNTQSVSDFDFK